MKLLWITHSPSEWHEADVSVITPQNFSVETVRQADVIFLAAGPQLEAQTHLIRQHPCPDVYLKPLFLVEEDTPLNLIHQQIADGSGPRHQLDTLWRMDWRPRAEAILARLQRLNNRTSSEDVLVSFKLLRWMYTRNQPATPLPSTQTPLAYVYPPLEVMLPTPDGTIQKSLEFLKTQGLVRSEFVDRIYQCHECECAFLNVRETCSDCGSSHLKIEDLIHHFRCGHVASMEDYQKNDALICPKCDRKLKMIGTDYDKPSSVYRCLSCGKTSQDTATLSTCYRCGKSVPAEMQAIRNIMRYNTSALAESVARFGMDSLFRQMLESEIEALPLPTWKRIVQLEIDRIERYQRSESGLMLLTIEGLEHLYLERGQASSETFAEIVGILKSVLRSTDILTTLNDSTYLILLTETPANGRERAITRVREGLTGLIQTQTGAHLEFRLAHSGLDAHQTVDQLLATLVASAN